MHLGSNGRSRTPSHPAEYTDAFRAHSSAGRASGWQPEGQGFESPWVHKQGKCRWGQSHTVYSANNIGDVRGGLHDLNPHLPLAVALVGSIGAVMSVVAAALGYRPPMGGYFSLIAGAATTGLCWWLYFHLRIPRDPDSKTDVGDGL
jgi:hypothetical protein